MDNWITRAAKVAALIFCGSQIYFNHKLLEYQQKQTETFQRISRDFLTIEPHEDDEKKVYTVYLKNFGYPVEFFPEYKYDRATYSDAYKLYASEFEKYAGEKKLGTIPQFHILSRSYDSRDPPLIVGRKMVKLLEITEDRKTKLSDDQWEIVVNFFKGITVQVRINPVPKEKSQIILKGAKL
eukprot:TRINITY_DN19492_c0_g1_i1.p1 TRINITY_DN19492_c0_g1~~TRINITY_DN19492_c0_g1_i1.p1  ORF type:complete len:182 (-),score=5.84 TRINITY_DN19492_c0_g1_i1:23-568(-)